MGAGRPISQEAFEEVVRENMDDLGMEPEEALQDAIDTLTLQGVDLSGIVKCVPGVSSAKDNPVILALEGLRKPGCSLDEKCQLLQELCRLCTAEGPDNPALAARNGAVELLCSVCSGAPDERALLPGLKALRAVLLDIQTTEVFRNNEGPKIIVSILNKSSQNTDVLDSAFCIVAAAAAGNEVVKEQFMDLKVDYIIVETLRGEFKGRSASVYDAIRVLLAADDNRVVASQVYGYARRFAKIGIADALVDNLHEGISSATLVSACSALKAVAVNDEICKSVSEKAGIDAILRCIDDSSQQLNKVAAKACCSLLSKLAGSDANKSIIVQRGGLDSLIKLSVKFSDDPSVLQEIMPIICTLSLRSRENAARAIEAGAGDMAVQAMQRFPAAHQMQKQSCLMIRNLVARSPENRTILLGMGIEKLIRKAKASHESCKDAASSALRDLGLDDYNS